MPEQPHPRFTLTDERAGLTSFLDAQRAGLLRKLEGVDDVRARERPTASSLSLLGLVKHSATWERRWFQVIVAGRRLPEQWPEVPTEPVDADLLVDDTDTLEHWVGWYREQIAESRAITAVTELDATCARTDIIGCNLRYVLLHMIEETARHAGHADIVRESLDGARGI